MLGGQPTLESRYPSFPSEDYGGPWAQPTTASANLRTRGCGGLSFPGRIALQAYRSDLGCWELADPTQDVGALQGTTPKIDTTRTEPMFLFLCHHAVMVNRGPSDSVLHHVALNSPSHASIELESGMFNAAAAVDCSREALLYVQPS